ncbi:MAG: type I restriction-modification system subunit M [Methanobrevibacter sp.]|nr:type I restriction-modification system subunit M [Methanobrevibacter sp.]
MSNFQEKVSFIWDLADLLRGSYKRNEYQKVILPFTVLKRFDSVLEYSKENVLNEYNKYKDSLDNFELLLMDAAVDEDGNNLGFYNKSKFDFKSLLADPEHLEENLIHYIDSFSSNVEDIFENFYIKNQITKLEKANLLYLLIQKFSETKVDLHPSIVSNHEMGLIFEELIRKFSEQSNEEAGEHFTPRDVVNLMTELMFVENGYHLKEENLIKKIYDPACGTGGMLTSCEDYIKERNDSIEVALYGQEVNEEIYAICKADMLMKGGEAHIKGPSSTLSSDQLPDDKFDYMISNPPYGRKWESDKDEVLKESELGYDGRFGAGTPRINDGQLLFLQHMISKMKTKERSRIAVITNGSPLFTGDAGSGESNIRKWIIENDYLEAIVGLPEQLFYNTGIKTYVWILTNEKPENRAGKIQLIDGTKEFVKMRKSLGSKRQELSKDNTQNIIDFYNTFEDTDKIKIFDNEDFGYTKIVVERPQQLNYQVSDERIENLYSIPAFSKLATSKSKDSKKKMKEEEKGKKEQNSIITSLKQIPNKIMKNWDEFDNFVSDELGSLNLTPTFKRNIILALSEHDDDADYVKDNKGKIKPNPNLRDTEKIPLKKDIEDYFKDEVQKYYQDAWMDRKKDKIGYEINFTQYFYKYEPPRPLEEIEEDIKKIHMEISSLIKKI